MTSRCCQQTGQILPLLVGLTFMAAGWVGTSTVLMGQTPDSTATDTARDARPDTIQQASSPDTLGQDTITQTPGADTTPVRPDRGRLPSLEEFRRRGAVREGGQQQQPQRQPTGQQQQDTSGGRQQPERQQGVAEGLREMTEEEAAVPTYVRERFTYPQGGRMDPVTPPASIASGDAFPELSLTGIVFDEENPEKSAALIRVGGNQERPRREVVRAGDRINQYEIADIQPNRVLIDIHLLGTVRTMELVKEQTGSPGQTGGRERRGQRRPGGG